MVRLRPSAPLRAFGTALALLLFAFGTHLCLVSGVAAGLGARVPMTCMPAAATAACPHCGAAGAAHGGGPAPRPATGAPSPCCLVLLPVTPPVLDGVTLTNAPALAAAAPPAPDARAAAPARAVAIEAHAPPGSVPRDAFGSRAPPLL